MRWQQPGERTLIIKDYDYFTKHDDGRDAHGKRDNGVSSYVASDDRPSRN